MYHYIVIKFKKTLKYEINHILINHNYYNSNFINFNNILLKQFTSKRDIIFGFIYFGVEMKTKHIFQPPSCNPNDVFLL